MNSDEFIENFIEPSEREEAKKNKGKNGFSEKEFIEEIKNNDEFAKDCGELGPIYGSLWREFGKLKEYDVFNTSRTLILGVDQIANLIKDLKENPDSRRLMVTAWNPQELPYCILPPCHYGFQCWTRELTVHERAAILIKRNPEYQKSLSSAHYHHDWLNKENIPKRSISLIWNQRSCDLFLGIPFNIASYGLLLSLLAKEVNMIPEELIGNLGDTHIYNNHFEACKEQMKNEGFELPRLEIVNYSDFDSCSFDNFQLLNYQSNQTVKAPLNN